VIDAKGIAMTEQASGPALPGEECRVPPHESWSDLEKWVWQEVGSGRTADINAKLGKSADPKKPEDWGPQRRLRPAFLETILLHNPWRSAIPRQGVRIVGALFDDAVDLHGLHITHEFWLDYSRFVADVDLSLIRAQFGLSLEGSGIVGTLNISIAQVKIQLNLSYALLANTKLISATITDNFFLVGANVSGALEINSASIDGSLVMNEGSVFADVDLEGAKIGGQLNLSGAKVKGKLNMNSAAIGHNYSCTKVPNLAR
jgi:hypothetical protein